jgi:hypothetical protein
MAKILHNGIVFAIFAHHIGLLNQNFFGCPKFVAFRPVQILRHYPITNCSVVCCTVVLRILKRRDEQRRSTLYKGRKERSFLFENVHVAARKIAQQRKFKKCGRVNSSRVYF